MPFSGLVSTSKVAPQEWLQHGKVIRQGLLWQVFRASWIQGKMSS